MCIYNLFFRKIFGKKWFIGFINLLYNCGVLINKISLRAEFATFDTGNICGHRINNQYYVNFHIIYNWERDINVKYLIQYEIFNIFMWFKNCKQLNFSTCVCV